MFRNYGEVFVLVVAVTFGTYTVQQENDPAYMAQYNSLSDGCAAQYNFTPDYVNNQIWNMTTLPTDKNMKCYLLCLNVKLNVMDDSGNINDDNMKKVSAEFYNATLTDDITKLCDISKEGDPCQTAYDCMQCVLNVQNGKLS